MMGGNNCFWRPASSAPHTRSWFMLVFVNGQFVAEEQATIPVYDRGFLYGDGLFETIRIHNSRPFQWKQHLARLEGGAAWLKIALSMTQEELLRVAQELIRLNGRPEALLRLNLSRGVGLRGYSPKGANSPCIVLSLHDVPWTDPSRPPGWRLVTAAFPMPAHVPLTQFKTCNKLLQVLARAEADAAGAQETLLLDSGGCALETTAANIFWVDGREVCTPPSTGSILPGITRSLILELARTLDLVPQEKPIDRNALFETDGVFLTLSSMGIAEAVSLDGRNLPRSPATQTLYGAYIQALNSL